MNRSGFIVIVETAVLRNGPMEIRNLVILMCFYTKICLTTLGGAERRPVLFVCTLKRPKCVKISIQP